jgi:4-hydroxy-tetrahydrodipicolinate synthase
VTTLSAGVWGVLATPFVGSTLDLDEASLGRLTAHYEQIGATGVTALGVFGEAARLSSKEREAVLEVVGESTTLPVVVGLTSLATEPCIEEASAASSILGSRVAAVMVQVNSSGREALRTHLRAVHEAASVPILVQDYPVASGVRVDPVTLADALADLPFVAAVKAESPPVSVAVAGLVSRLPGVPVFGGLGGIGLLDELAAGASGAMTGFSLPEALVATVRAFEEGGLEAARETFLPYLPLVNFEQQPGIALAIRKEVLRRRGLILESGVRAPAASMPEALVALLKAHLSALDLVPG